jgi:hypothetical protein
MAGKYIEGIKLFYFPEQKPVLTFSILISILFTLKQVVIANAGGRALISIKWNLLFRGFCQAAMELQLLYGLIFQLGCDCRKNGKGSFCHSVTSVVK